MPEIKTLTFDQLAVVYRAAFDQVCDPADWRGPINCLVPWDVANIYMQAIEFMTGVKPECTHTVDSGRRSAHLVCVGYRNGPCGG